MNCALDPLGLNKIPYTAELNSEGDGSVSSCQTDPIRRVSPLGWVVSESEPSEYKL